MAHMIPVYLASVLLIRAWHYSYHHLPTEQDEVRGRKMDGSQCQLSGPLIQTIWPLLEWKSVNWLIRILWAAQETMEWKASKFY